MVPRQLPLIRAVAQAALQQNKLTPYAYDDVIHWIDRLERESQFSAGDDLAIRQASEVMISRLRQSSLIYEQATNADLLKLEAL